MTLPRASAGLLRTHIRRPARQVSTPPLRQIATTRRLAQDGGRPPPPAEGESQQKTWALVGGAGLAAVVGYAYFFRPSKDVPTKATENVAAAGAEAGKDTNWSAQK